VLYSLVLLARDLAVLAAAALAAKWIWDNSQAAPLRRDEEARDRLQAERLSTDLGQRAARIEALMVDISTRLDEVLGREREAEQRAADKLRIHRLLHATSDPFLSFAEVEAALAREPAASASSAGDPDQVGNTADAISGDRLRRALMELVGDGVVAQLDGDRYFVSTDFETGDDGQAPGAE
jgi:hypothetical protein